MEHQSDQLLRSNHGDRSIEDYSDQSCQLHCNLCVTDYNRLPQVNSKDINTRLPSEDSGVTCKCQTHSGSCSETANDPFDLGPSPHLEHLERRRKSVTFSFGSSSNLNEDIIGVSDFNIDRNLDTRSEPFCVHSQQSKTVDKRNDNINYFPGHLSACSNGIGIKSNTTSFKRQRSSYSESDGNYDRISNYNHHTSKLKTRKSFPTLGKSLNKESRSDQISALHHPVSLSSPQIKSQGNIAQCLPCTCRDNIQPISKENRFRSHPDIYKGNKRSFDPQSYVSLMDDINYTESRGTCATSQISRCLPLETQPNKTTAGSEISDININKKECVVSIQESVCTTKTCFVILLLFNVIFLVAIVVIILTLFNQRNYQECPLCKDVMDKMNGLKGININESFLRDYFKGKDKTDHCCLTRTFIYNLMSYTYSRNQPLLPNTELKVGDVNNVVRNSSQKAVLHLESSNGTIPSSYQLLDDASSKMEMMKWSYDSKTTVQIGRWDFLDSNTTIKIPFTGFYYIYAMVQYRYQPLSSNHSTHRVSSVEEFPMSISIYKIPPLPETKAERIGTVIKHCKLTNISIEHNVIIERIELLTEREKVFLAVSNKQFLKNGYKVHHIGLFRVD